MSVIKTGSREKTKEEQNLAIARRYILEYFNRGDADVIDEIFPQDCIINQEYTQTNEERKQYIARIRASFPDLKKTIVEEIVVGDKVVLSWVATGTNLGDFMGFAPTGKKMNVRGIYIFRIVDGKIVEMSYVFDRLGRLQQLGYELVPPGEQDGAPGK
jgi:steroid delta-isomerase-like uncharacterized protein